MLNRKLKNQKGFTIIEVMIVLAIAGLILLIVFLAVPALQRSARNTQRKNDAGNLSSSISAFVSNNNGDVPGYDSTGTYSAATCKSNIDSIVLGIHLGYYTNANVTCGSATSPPTVCKTTGTSSCAAGSLTTENMIFIPGNVCSNNAPTTANATSRSYALLYMVETGTAPAEQCIEG